MQTGQGNPDLDGALRLGDAEDEIAMLENADD
jgi:hypothetical protein